MVWLNNFLSRSPWVHGAFDRWGRFLFYTFQGFGDFVFFTVATVKWTFIGPFRLRLLFRELLRIGAKSSLIIILVGLFAGMVFALQAGSAFRLINAESLVGSTVGITLSRELAPVLTALMIIARACSAMAAELGTMRVTEQMDALSSMAINPINYLVAPKVIATTIAVPLLVAIFNAAGLFGSWLVAVKLMGIPEGPYLFRYYKFVDPHDFLQGYIKAVFFGFVISLIACYKGYHTTNGAEGVGRSTTGAVVAGSVTILVLNYFLASWLLQIFPDRR